MTVSLQTLADRLQRAVPARNGVPGDYEQLCRDAVAQLSQDLPVITSATIQVTAGVAAYALPADFLSVIELGGVGGGSGVIVGDNGLIPVGGGWQEMHYIEGDSIRFEPVPAYTAARTLRYAAQYTANAGGVYPRLSENGARVALLYAQYLALLEQANAVAGDGWSYKIGDESVDKRGVGAAIQAQAAQALTGYHNAMRPLQGYGSRYRQNPYAVGAQEV
jgi:hypothetical protein